MNPFTNQNKRKQRSSNRDSEQQLVRDGDAQETEDHDMAGGFVPEDYQDDIDGGGFIPALGTNGEESIVFMIDHGESAVTRKSITGASVNTNILAVSSSGNITPTEAKRYLQGTFSASGESSIREVAKVREQDRKTAAKAGRATMRGAKSSNNIANEPKQNAVLRSRTSKIGRPSSPVYKATATMSLVLRHPS
jgi:hypothetical protein